MHAVIEVSEDGVAIIDLSSSTGTTVNGKKVNREFLQSGDHLRLGGTDIIIGI